MLLRLCQLKTLALVALLVTGCSLFRSNHSSEEMVSMIEPKWFSGKPQHSIVDQSGKFQPHLFFDVLPEPSSTGNFANVIIVTPEDSEHAYSLDLNSGQRYFDHPYCKQKDIWNVYNGSVGKPHFSVTIMPRMLDQLGEAQKVIVFGGGKKFAAYPDMQFHRVRLIGAYVEQKCLEGNCLGKSNWLSKLVFLAVDPETKSLDKIQTIEDFQKKMDWVETKATLENMGGYNGLGDLKYPSIRIGQLIPLTEAVDYHSKRSIYLSEKETTKIQDSCTTLYDRFYTEVGMERPEDKVANTVEELNAKIKLKEELKKKRLPAGFSKRLAAFTNKYSQEMASCERFVYHGNINQDREKFWFLSYMGIFYRLHRDGYYFDCNRKSWQKNVLDNNGKLVFDIKEEINKCSDRDIDLAMDYLGNFLAGLKVAGSAYYKFIDYDTHGFGTHRKMYSWVKVPARTFNCSSKLNETVSKELKIFPEDISWKNRDVKDIADRMKIIY